MTKVINTIFKQWGTYERGFCRSVVFKLIRDYAGDMKKICITVNPKVGVLYCMY